MNKILSIIGARPQFIKSAAITYEFSQSSILDEIVIHTGQHYDKNMSDVFFDEMNIPKPKYNLGIGGGTHGQNTGRMIIELEKIITSEKPKMLIVYGDTDSTLAGAIAASKLRVPIAHIESGLRSYNFNMPEEINRKITDQVSTLLFCPSEASVENLQKEGVPADRIHVVGDIMFDSLKMFLEKALKRAEFWRELPGRYVYATIHRAENTDDEVRLRKIFTALEKSGEQIILPIHPRTKIKIDNFQITIPQNIKVIEPVGYLDSIYLQSKSCYVVTDSGGMQKEAYFLGRNCVVFRDETEWTELTDSGWNILVGPNHPSFSDSLINPSFSLECRKDLYGNGDSAAKIRSVIENFIKNEEK